MLRNDYLNLPDNWEDVLELTMLQRPLGTKRARTYICSPCRADRPENVIKNMKAARVYMFYAYIHFQGVPRAPHAYLPVLLNDNFNDERNIALMFGERLLMDCDMMLVCGNRLSEGMYGEIKLAVKREIPVRVFNKQVCDDLSTHLSLDGINPDYPQYEGDRLHPTLAWGADDLAPYWDENHEDTTGKTCIHFRGLDDCLKNNHPDDSGECVYENGVEPKNPVSRCKRYLYTSKSESEDE